MKRITRLEAENLFCEIGHHANITIPVYDENGEVCYKSVLNQAVVYNPYHTKQIGTSSNEQNAKSAMRFVKDSFRVYSSVFAWATDDYEIED